MIPIRFNLDDEFKNWYIDIINNLIIDHRCTEDNQKLKLADTYRKINDNLEKLGITKKFNDFLFADFKELRQIYEKLSKPETNYFNEDFVILTKIYNKLVGEKNNLKIIEKYNSRVCPYCNREYINNRKTAATAQIDHFYPKSINAIFSLCLFNMIPACYGCNHIKSENEILISPHDTLFDFERALRFSYTPHTVDFLFDKIKVRVELRTYSETDKGLLDNITKLQIGEAYATHNDYVQELIEKVYIYNELQIKEYIDDFAVANLTREEILSFVFNMKFTSNEFNQTPLSKLTSDILKELNLEISNKNNEKET